MSEAVGIRDPQSKQGAGTVYFPHLRKRRGDCLKWRFEKFLLNNGTVLGVEFRYWILEGSDRLSFFLA